MEVLNEVMPGTEGQMKAMMEPGPQGPIFMVNLLKFREYAEYKDGRETDLSGREAYNLYAQEVIKVIQKFGGQVIFAGDVTFLALGQVEELWDEVAIAVYSCRGDMVRMSMSPEWQAIGIHRVAGLKGQLHIETVLPEGGALPWMEPLLAKIGGKS